MLTAPQTLVNANVKSGGLAFVRVEHDKAARGIEGDSEGTQRVATEKDGRALLSALDEVGRDTSEHERADADGRRTHAARRDFAARDVARARALLTSGRENAERTRGALVNSESETRTRVEQRAPAFGQHDKWTTASTVGQPGHDRPALRRVAR